MDLEVAIAVPAVFAVFAVLVAESSRREHLGEVSGRRQRSPDPAGHDFSDRAESRSDSRV